LGGHRTLIGGGFEPAHGLDEILRQIAADLIRLA